MCCCLATYRYSQTYFKKTKKRRKHQSSQQVLKTKTDIKINKNEREKKIQFITETRLTGHLTHPLTGEVISAQSGANLQ